MNKVRLFTPARTELNVETRCPVCLTEESQIASRQIGESPSWYGWCPACTNVRITKQAAVVIRAQGKAHLLAAYLRELPASAWDQLFLIRSPEQAERLADTIVPLKLSDQFDLLLRRLCESTEEFGKESNLDIRFEWPEIRAKSANEAVNMLRSMEGSGYLEVSLQGGNWRGTAKQFAFQRVEELKAAGPDSQQAFVAMAFAPQFDAAWTDIIQPGITAAGYRPFRVDQKEHSGKIDDLIIAEIRRSKFLVADFSGQRGGVYFEAGFAQGLGRPVVWMCQESEINKVHFDTRQYNHIVYSDSSAARLKLTNRIVAVIGEGSYKQN